LLTVSDSRILSTLTDAVVLVTRAYSTPFDLVRRARGLLYNSGARILGVALNSVSVHKQGSSGYGVYRYGYGYGYGYEPDSDEDSASQSESQG
jgi:Mrp family chromosome partitioning ATPase